MRTFVNPNTLDSLSFDDALADRATEILNKGFIETTGGMNAAQVDALRKPVVQPAKMDLSTATDSAKLDAIVKYLGLA